MKVSDLERFLTEKISTINFIKLISTEVNLYKINSNKKGSSVNIILEVDSNNFVIGISEIKILCLAFLNEELTEWYIYYICDALLLSQDIIFVDDFTKNVIEDMTDPTINGKLTKEKITMIEPYKSIIKK